MKILQVEAERASLEELEAIKIALEKIATEIFVIDATKSTEDELRDWRFSGRWWLETNNGNHQIGNWR